MTASCGNYSTTRAQLAYAAMWLRARLLM